MIKHLRIHLLLSLVLFSCSNASSTDTGIPCNGQEPRCDGQKFQVCETGTFSEQGVCAGTTSCDPVAGCVECDPGRATTCQDNAVYACTDGVLGEIMDICSSGCSDGSCAGQGQGCSAASELVYVVDNSHQLFSFDPSKLATEPFALLGTLDCPAAAALPDFGIGEATPFSMSVDRSGTAWVLYSSGEIFHVSTADASCQATSYTIGQQGFELFGMGFVADAPGANSETLYIAGGAAGAIPEGNLGALNPQNIQISTVGDLPGGAFGPELTGTGDAKLYGYFPGSFDNVVAAIDKQDVSQEQQWSLDPLDGTVEAWAFAHWGGRFYIFVTTGGFFSSTSQVIEFDPVSGQQQTVVDDSDYRVVGAGVSTCAPISID